jgi:hypothetical protein
MFLFNPVPNRCLKRLQLYSMWCGGGGRGLEIRAWALRGCESDLESKQMPLHPKGNQEITLSWIEKIYKKKFFASQKITCHVFSRILLLQCFRLVLSQIGGENGYNSTVCGVGGGGVGGMGLEIRAWALRGCESDLESKQMALHPKGT